MSKQSGTYKLLMWSKDLINSSDLQYQLLCHHLRAFEHSDVQQPSQENLNPAVSPQIHQMAHNVVKLLLPASFTLEKLNNINYSCLLATAVSDFQLPLLKLYSDMNK